MWDGTGQETGRNPRWDCMWRDVGGAGSGAGWSTRGRLIGWDGGRGVSCHGTGIGMGDGMGVGLGRKVKWE